MLDEILFGILARNERYEVEILEEVSRQWKEVIRCNSRRLSHITLPEQAVRLQTFGSIVGNPPLYNFPCFFQEKWAGTVAFLRLHFYTKKADDLGCAGIPLP